LFSKRGAGAGNRWVSHWTVAGGAAAAFSAAFFAARRGLSDARLQRAEERSVLSPRAPPQRSIVDNQRLVQYTAVLACAAAAH